MEGRKRRTSGSIIWKISLPLVICGINDAIVEATDTAFLARYGIVELGAVGVAFSIYQTAIFFMAGLSDGIQIITARRAGQAKGKGIGDTFNQGVTILLATSVLVFCFLKFASPLLTLAVLRSEDVRSAVDDFLAIAAFSVFCDSLNFAYSGFFSGIGRTRVFLAASAAMAITNLAVDYVLIFGRLGFPQLGIEGAAIGSLLAEAAMLAFLTFETWRRGYIRRFGLFKLRPPTASLSRLILAVSSPLSLEVLIQTARWFAFFAIIERMGEQALASASMIFSCYVIFLIIIDGFSETAVTMVSNLVGRDESERIQDVILGIVLRTSVFMAPFVALALVGPEIVLSLFTSQPDLLRASADSLRVVGLAVLIAIPAEMAFAAVAGTGDTRATLVIELLLSVGVLSYVITTAIVYEFPLEIIWGAEIAGWLLGLVLSWTWLASRRWERLNI